MIDQLSTHNYYFLEQIISCQSIVLVFFLLCNSWDYFATCFLLLQLPLQYMFENFIIVIYFPNFQDPLNSMVIRCDAKLQDLLGCESISALGIQEMLARHHLFKKSWPLIWLVNIAYVVFFMIPFITWCGAICF